jgi:hypothetical protein
MAYYDASTQQLQRGKTLAMSQLNDCLLSHICSQILIVEFHKPAPVNLSSSVTARKTAKGLLAN